jgi:hypothetical protein
MHGQLNLAWQMSELSPIVLLALAPYTISSLDGSCNMQVEYLPVVYPPEIKQENALHFAENVNMLSSKICHSISCAFQ